MLHLIVPHLRAVHSSALHVVGAGSYAPRQARGRRRDVASLAFRCMRALPAHLSWAAAMLDPERPLPVICGEPEVREFFHWLESPPNTERVSIGCDRQGSPQGDARA
jgi:hypothetical protein